MESKLSIGDMAKLHDVTIHTLRYYDKIGLLKPSQVDQDTGYRYYDDYACYQLGKIKSLKAIGLSLEEIEVLVHGNIHETERAFIDYRQKVKEQIEILQERLYYLDDQLKQIEEFKEGHCFTEPCILHFPLRKGYLIGVEEDYTIRQRIMALTSFDKKHHTNADIFFVPTRLLKLDEEGTPQLDNYLALQRGNHKGDPKDQYNLETGSYAVLDHIGNSQDLTESYTILLNYIKAMGYEPEGLCIEVLCINDNITNEGSEKRTQLQIPIKRAKA